MMNGPRFICSKVVTAFVLALATAGALAQVANNTALVGNVVDPSGLPVVGAAVTAVNEETKVAYPGKTDGDGYYSIKFILPGTYDITVEETGFSVLKKTGQIVAIDEARRTDFKLQIGSETTSVSVTASSPPISTDDATLGETFDTKTVDELPLMGHNALEAAATSSNIMIGPSSGYQGVPPGEDFIGAGQREIQNLITLDGITILNSLISLAPGRPSSDMIAEVQTQSGNYTAQYGNYLGVHINMVTKSGTNTLHGAAYEYLQNTAFNAHHFTDQPGSPNEIQHYNQPGFAVGGPVYLPKIYDGRNKTFFFASWEKIRQIQQNSSGKQSTFTSAEEAGNFGALCSSYDSSGNCTGSGTQLTDPFTGNPYPYNQIPSGELSSPAAAVSKKLEQYFPAPNLNPSNPALLNNYSTNYPSNTYIWQTIDRVDENIGQNVKLFFRVDWQDLNYLAGAFLPANNTYGPTNQRNYTVGYTQTITPNLINDARAGVNQVSSSSYDYWYENALVNAGTSLGIPGFTGDTTYKNPGIPSIYFNEYAGGELGNSSADWVQSDRAVDGYDQLSWVHGKHNIMAGFELIRMTIAREATNDLRGQFTFDGSLTGFDGADFVLGLPQNSTTDVLPTNGAIGEWRDGFYVLDSWRPFEKLTLDLGLRYELPTVPYSLNGYARILNPQETALIPTSSAILAANFVPDPGLRFNGPNHNDWAPRLGFAYRITPQTVIRGGGGIYFNANQLNTYTLTTQNFPLSASEDFQTGTGPNLLSFSNPTPGAATDPTPSTPGSYLRAVTMGPYLPTQQLQQWNLSVGQSLWQNAGLELQYLGSHGLHLDRDFYDNTPIVMNSTSVNSRRPNQAWGRIRRIQNDNYAHYNAFTAVFRQRLAHGVSANLSYTWAHDLDISDNSNNGGTTMDQYDIGLDYGNSNWDIRHRFVGVASYDLPKFGSKNAFLQEAIGGWQANAIVTLQTGDPVNVNLGFDLANISLPNGNTQRPNWVHSASAHCSLKNYIAGNTTSCIDTTAFTLPAPYTFGTSHRNTLTGPGMSRVDFSLFKDFAIREQFKFQFRAEAENLFNHPNAAAPYAEIDDTSYTPSNPTSEAQNFGFGTVTGTSSTYTPRFLQLSGKLVF
jgi:Carboxypeptidase regulatory-like domain